MTAVELLLETIGFTIIYGAVNHNREVKIKVFTSEWYAIMAMLIIGGSLVKINI